MARSSFKFRLQKLLDIRIMTEKREQQVLLTLKAKLVAHQQKLLELNAHEQEVIQMMNPTPGESFDVEERMMLERYLETVQKDQQRQIIVIQGAEEDVRKQQAVLVQASVDVKALEKLKEKQAEEHHEEQLREQAYFLDDISSQQYIRQVGDRERIAEEDAAAASEVGR